MKKRNFNFLMIALILSAAYLMESCNNPCKDVSCYNGGNCVDGTCVCTPGFTGTNCSTVDFCYSMNCLNGGSCVNGTCECVGGYEGINCGTPMNEKFLGVYTVSDQCLTSAYSQTISEGAAPNEIIFNNMGNYITPAVVHCTVNGTAISVTNFEDTSGRKFTVNGTITGQNISLAYTVTYSDLTTETCGCSYVRDN